MHITILDKEQQNMQYVLSYMKRNYPTWNVTTCRTTFELATVVYDEFKGDVEVLIMYVDKNGESIALARDLQQFFPHIKVIFYSENTDCAEAMFEVVPLFFLKLPFKEEMLKKALERVCVSYEEDIGRTLVIESRGRKQKIRFSMIKFIESAGRKLLLYTDEGVFETYMTINEMLEKLPSQFMQCHRSYIVNCDKIEKYSIEELFLIGGDYVPVSRTYHKTMKEIIG